ncbi:DNA-binding transcriptional regulator, MarR family [Desulfocicer vacuolatum DSM 3385]|uniref:DNA-binding transcriptional regulator, MarR family n=1 Tax=Desulfocicer vacuolatum DSM 3385 TaxID=1121400 RepID=A0A1W2A6Z0_9BACT|nr:MarR family winged helix-turn-helix transcriptional regulator [Desulfocicer vacuolatum]SMC56343.1 DNA-binding transcriptional regulator, MarR family [Desulfocicer vacuolatum DSM 3385]
MSIYENAGTLFLGSRLKRLSDQFLSDLGKIYEGAGISFEPTWFPIFYLLDTTEDVTISRIAKQLEITHSGASQMVTSLKKKGFVEISRICQDRRLKTVAFTARGKAKLKEIKPVWRALRESMDDLLSPKGQRSRVLGLLEELEAGMARMDLVMTVEKRLLFNQFLDEIEIVPYLAELHDALMALVLGWIADNPHTLHRDVNWMHQMPFTVSGGKMPLILMAVHQKEVICACVAMPDSRNHSAELSLVFKVDRFSTHLVQALWDQMNEQLEKKGIFHAIIRTDITHSSLLKILQKNGFKLREVEKSAAGHGTCMCLSRNFKKGIKS